VRLEELGKLKNPMNSSGTELATFQLVAQNIQFFFKRVLHLATNNPDKC
jgi:hypothetical protein